MRLHILRTLLRKEAHRHLLNRGGLALGGLLVVAALLLSVFDPTRGGGGGTGGAEGAVETGGLVGGVHHCYVLYDVETNLVQHLRKHVPDALRQAVVVSKWKLDEVPQLVTAQPGVGAIVLHRKVLPNGRRTLRFEVWHPQGNPAAMAAYEQWFWKEARRGLQAEAADKLREEGADAAKLTAPQLGDDDLWAVLESFRGLTAQVDLLRAAGTAPPGADAILPDVSIERKGQAGRPLDLRTAIATAMVVFALYFTCVYLLPTLNCEERERGVLLAQALSPASPAEIVTAKFLFYPTLGMGLAAALAGIYRPAVLGSPFFWLSLFAVACGFLGIGMTIASLSRTQRGAFLGSMCYLMSVALLLMICQQNGIRWLPYLTLEFHGPRILHAAITGDVVRQHWFSLLEAAALAAAWLWVAGALFRRRGWQ